MPCEIELKLAFPATAHSQLLRHPMLASAERLGRAQTLINTYFDTPDMKLSARAIALRTRKAGRHWVQTVKCAAISSGGLTSRPEWEYAYHGTFDFEGISDPDVRSFLEKNIDSIDTMFTTNFRRETFVLYPRPGARILAMVDTGEIEAQGRKEKIHELELELAEGTVQDILDLACTLAHDLPLQPYDPSKAERGYQLYRDEHRRIPQVTNIVSPDFNASALDIFRHLARENLRVWAANQFQASCAEDPECIHQLRLSLRQLRNLIRLFKPVLPPAFVEKWTETLASQADELANARDLDVLCEDLLPKVGTYGIQDQTTKILEHARHVSTNLYKHLKQQLHTQGSGELVLAFMRDIHALPSPEENPSTRKIANTAILIALKLSHKRLQRAESIPSAANLHRLRIAIKRLRHTLDVFSPLLPKKTHQMLNKLSHLQRDLGRQHDLNVALPQLQAWSQQKEDLQEAAAFVSGWLAATNLQLERSIVPACAKMLKNHYWRDFK